jgi:hypothetical protein
MSAGPAPDVRIQFPPNEQLELDGTPCLVHSRWSFWCWWRNEGCRVYLPDFQSVELTITIGRRKTQWTFTPTGKPGEMLATPGPKPQSRHRGG